MSGNNGCGNNQGTDAEMKNRYKKSGSIPESFTTAPVSYR
jgi:hypothetical protein